MSRSRGDGEVVSTEKKVRRPGGGGGVPVVPSTGGSIGSMADGYLANDAEDLSSAC